LDGLGLPGCLPGPRGAPDHAHRAHRPLQHPDGGTDMTTLTVALQTDKTIAEYGALSARVGALGFDGPSAYADLGFQPPLPALLTAAAHAPGLRLGAAALSPYLTHPLEIAGQTATLLDATAGNAYLGLVRGAWLGEAGVR